MFWHIFSLFCLLELYLWYVSLLLCRYVSDVHLDLAPVEKFSQVGLIFRNLWWSFLQRLGREFFRRMLRPRVRFIMWIRIRAWPWAWFRIRIRIRTVSRAIPSNHILRRSRRLLQRFNARKNLCRMIKLSRAWIPWRSSTPLSERHAGIFLSGCDNRTILAKYVTSFAPVAQHHPFREKDIPLDIAIERNFPWPYCWISPAGKILACLFPFLMDLVNLSLPLNTDTTSPKLEKASLAAWSLMNSGRRMVTKIGSLPFLRGPIRFRKLRKVSESPKRHWISVTWSFSFAAFDPKTKTNFEGETYTKHLSLWLPKIPEYGKYPILEPFFGSSLSTLNGQTMIFP